MLALEKTTKIKPKTVGYYFSLILTRGHFFIAFRESKGERETSMQERSISWLPPYMPRPGTKPTTSWLWDNAPTN